jgi:hypothetical protein
MKSDVLPAPEVASRRGTINALLVHVLRRCKPVTVSLIQRQKKELIQVNCLGADAQRVCLGGACCRLFFGAGPC